MGEVVDPVHAAGADDGVEGVVFEGEVFFIQNDSFEVYLFVPGFGGIAVEETG